MCIDSRPDLGQGSDVGGSRECVRFFAGTGCPAVTYDHGGGMRSLPQILLGMTRLAMLSPVAWAGQACALQLDLHLKRVLFIMRYL